MRFACTYQNCNKEYSNTFNLKRHVESFHLGLKHFSCSVCGKGLSTKQNMREHSFIHLDIKPYVCQFRGCLKGFRQLSQLKIHLKMHREVEKVICKEKRGEIEVDFSEFVKGLNQFSFENLEGEPEKNEPETGKNLEEI